MSEAIPASWEKASIKDLVDASVVYGILQPGPDTVGGVPYIRPTEIESDVIQVDKLRRTTGTIASRYARSAIRPDDVILSIVGTIGKVAVVPPELEGANITQSSCRIRVQDRVLLPKYMAYALRSPLLRQQFDACRLGTAVPRLNIAHVRDLVIPIAPLPEQRRIVAKIEELFSDLDAGVAALERVRAKLKRYRAAVLNAAVTGKLTEAWRRQNPPAEPADKLLARILEERRQKWEADQLRKFAEAGKTPPKGWREKYEEPSTPTTAEDLQPPSGWCLATVGQCAWDVTVGHVGPMKERYVEVGLPFLRSQNVRPLRFSREGLKYIPADFHSELSKSRLIGGEVLVVRSGNVGEACVYPSDAGEANCSDLVVTRLLDAVEPQYLATFVVSPRGRASVLGKKTGSALPHFNVGAMERSSLLVPPLAEQREIIAEVHRHLSVIENAESEVDHGLKRATRLRQAILKRAFEGKLVPQDPSDEPAAELLKRMKAGDHRNAAASPELKPRRPRKAATSIKEGLFDAG